MVIVLLIVVIELFCVTCSNSILSSQVVELVWKLFKVIKLLSWFNKVISAPLWKASKSSNQSF